MTGERRVYALLALSARSGAATTCVGLLGLEDTGDEWVSEISYLPTSEGETDGGWPERIELARGARGLDPRTVAFWDETANGVLWGVTEIPESELASFESLSCRSRCTHRGGRVKPGSRPRVDRLARSPRSLSVAPVWQHHFLSGGPYSGDMR